VKLDEGVGRGGIRLVVASLLLAAACGSLALATCLLCGQGASETDEALVVLPSGGGEASCEEAVEAARAGDCLRAGRALERCTGPALVVSHTLAERACATRPRDSAVTWMEPAAETPPFPRPSAPARPAAPSAPPLILPSALPSIFPPLKPPAGAQPLAYNG
jgi:hypothetical protein